MFEVTAAETPIFFTYAYMLITLVVIMTIKEALKIRTCQKLSVGENFYSLLFEKCKVIFI